MAVNYEFMKSQTFGLPYKYVVFSPRVDVVGHPFEKLHGAPYSAPDGAENNRLLRLPEDKLKPGGMYIDFIIFVMISYFVVTFRHYDTVILPDAKARVEKGAIKKLLTYLPFYKSEPDDPDAITVPTPLIMRSQCIEIYLEPTKKLLTAGNFKAKFTIQDGIDLILRLFEDIDVQLVEYGGRVGKWTVEGLNQVSVFITRIRYNYYAIFVHCSL